MADRAKDPYVPFVTAILPECNGSISDESTLQPYVFLSVYGRILGHLPCHRLLIRSYGLAIVVMPPPGVFSHDSNAAKNPKTLS